MVAWSLRAATTCGSVRRQGGIDSLSGTVRLAAVVVDPRRFLGWVSGQQVQVPTPATPPYT
jgi:hypothetical protein